LQIPIFLHRINNKFQELFGYYAVIDFWWDCPDLPAFPRVSFDRRDKRKLVCCHWIWIEQFDGDCFSSCEKASCVSW